VTRRTSTPSSSTHQPSTLSNLQSLLFKTLLAIVALAVSTHVVLTFVDPSLADAMVETSLSVVAWAAEYDTSLDPVQSVVDALQATKHAARLWARVLHPLAVWGVKGAWHVALLATGVTRTHVAPAVRHFLVTTDPVILAFIGLFFAAVVAAALFWRCVRRRRYIERTAAAAAAMRASIVAWYDAWMERISAQSRATARVVAALLPHVLLACGVGLAFFVAPETMGKLCAADGGAVVLTLLALVASARAVLIALHQDRGGNSDDGDGTSSSIETSFNASEFATPTPFKTSTASTSSVLATPAAGASRRRKNLLSSASSPLFFTPAPPRNAAEAAAAVEQNTAAVSHWLRLWVVIAASTLLTAIPFVPFALSYVTCYHEVRFVALLWLMLPATDGATVAFSLLVPLINRHVKAIPKMPVDAAKSNLVLRALVFARVISERRQQQLQEVLSHGGSIILLATVFFFTPGFVTQYGCILVGVAFPLYESVLAQRAPPRRSSCVWWLTYWLAYVVAKFAHAHLSARLGSLPLWSHVELAATIWLQLPYFRGAQRVFVWTVERCVMFGTFVTTSQADVKLSDSGDDGNNDNDGEYYDGESDGDGEGENDAMATTIGDDDRGDDDDGKSGENSDGDDGHPRRRRRHQRRHADDEGDNESGRDVRVDNDDGSDGAEYDDSGGTYSDKGNVDSGDEANANEPPPSPPPPPSSKQKSPGSSQRKKRSPKKKR
jgi:hypothetical protein